jgi:hypothetical protein
VREFKPFIVDHERKLNMEANESVKRAINVYRHMQYD